ncbi:uncharacterized protein LOC117589537 [Drosophila guanche]|uniref:uncharacterized protein LOC117589537 n=1 Tax=Drosophila guanche TaxID=7266 RepID=UPI00147244DC|nr:uncharacterized protein LOC117589537 [Drosophila guanche]
MAADCCVLSNCINTDIDAVLAIEPSLMNMKCQIFALMLTRLGRTSELPKEVIPKLLCKLRKIGASASYCIELDYKRSSLEGTDYHSPSQAIKMMKTTAIFGCVLIAALCIANLPFGAAVTCAVDPTDPACIDCTVDLTNIQCVLATTTVAPEVTTVPGGVTTVAPGAGVTTAAPGTSDTTTASTGTKKKTIRKYKRKVKGGKTTIKRSRKTRRTRNNSTKFH